MRTLLTISIILLLSSAGFCTEENKNKDIHPESLNKSNDAFTVHKNNSIPEYFQVKQNYPNPFNATTIIEYDLPNRATTSLTIYNTLGQKIRTLENEIKEAGRYVIEWDGKNKFGQDVASGIYFYVVLADEYYGINKMVLLK